MAKKKGVNGWHSMRKDELIRALVREAKKKEKAKNGATKNGKAASAKNGKVTRNRLNGKATTNGASNNGTKGRSAKATASSKKASTSPKPTSAKASRTKSTSRKIAASKKEVPSTDPRVVKRIQQAAKHRLELKNLARDSSLNDTEAESVRKDRIVLLVRDPFWLQAYWEIKRTTIDRIRAAMSEHWHGAVPTLRVTEIESINTTSTSERVVRDIEIHGGVSNWYIDVVDPPKCYRVAIGYMATNGKFHAIARSNRVTTPQPGSSDAVDENWTDIASDCEKVYALSGGYDDSSENSDLRNVFEEQMERPIGTPAVNRYGIGADGRLRHGRTFGFEVDAEMVIYGATEPNAFVTLAGEPVKLREDGTFTVRCSMPDKRQVLPVVASSSDGIEQRTTVLAVERNTKVMEPLRRDDMTIE